MTSITAHHRWVRQMRCCVTGRLNPTLHHCHGGSLVDEFPTLSRGKGQKTSDWLVIPLDYELHTGRLGIDYGMGVRTWEARFGLQTDFLREVSDQVGFDVIARALGQ